MKETAKTEQEMRAAKAPAPATAEELAEYIAPRERTAVAGTLNGVVGGPNG